MVRLGTVMMFGGTNRRQKHINVCRKKRRSELARRYIRTYAHLDNSLSCISLKKPISATYSIGSTSIYNLATYSLLISPLIQY